MSCVVSAVSKPSYTKCSLQQVYHGDVKIDNVLLTSWNWVYLGDFASFKPTHLPVDDPAAFSYFFDISGRRTCGVAPERYIQLRDIRYESATHSNPASSFRKWCLVLQASAPGRWLCWY